MPPTFTELERRLRGRGTEEEDVIKQRMENSLGEIARATEYDYIVVNDNIEVAVDNINSVIQGHRLRLSNQKHIINEVLKKC